jgi:hypothetical protein
MNKPQNKIKLFESQQVRQLYAKQRVVPQLNNELKGQRDE